MAIWQKKDNSTPDQDRSGTFFSMLPVAIVMCALVLVLAAVAKNVSYTSQGPSLELLDVEKQDITHLSGKSDCLLDRKSVV